jgi:acyl carrier protein phosphodiesterase
MKVVKEKKELEDKYDELERKFKKFVETMKN